MTHGITATIYRHNHCGCQHALQYCEICDVVYCLKCGKEWKHFSYNNWIVTYQPSETWSYDGSTGTVTCGTTHQHSGG